LLSGCVSGIVSTFQSTTTETFQQKNNGTNDDAVITCYVSGIPHTQMISYESGTYLKELFSALALANAHDPCSAETQFLQQQILTYAEQQGLLPAGMSADRFLAQLKKQGQGFATKSIGGNLVYPLGIGREMFCNFVATGEGAAFPIIILPRFIPFIMTPIPRLFVGWKTSIGITSVGGLVSGTGFYAVGEQQGFALGFWGIGFSIFLPPIKAYGMFGYALYAKASAEYMEFYPPNHPPEIAAMYPLDGATYVPLSTSELRFSISDYDSDLMSYSVTTYPDVGGGNGNMKPDGTYTVPVSGLKSSTEYTWYVTVSDGMDTVEEEFTFTTEAVAPVVSDVIPVDGNRYVPVSQGFLRFHLRDPQNDLMSYTVETSPFIGSGSGSGVHEGDISVPISGLEAMTKYRWYVNVTDGVNPTSEVFWFQTEPLMVFDPFTEGWEYRKMITVDHSMVAGDLENFPVVLELTDSDLRDKAQDDGDDILFMDGAGVATRLYHELEDFDGSTGQLIAWVNISSLNSTVDSSLYMYYGHMDSCEQQYPEKTWDAQYKGVWHMHTASGSITDSTVNHHNGIVSSISCQAAGRIGYGVEDDGTGYVDFGDQIEYETQDITYEIWSIHDYEAQELDGGLAKGRVFGDYTTYSSQIAWHLGESSYSVILTDGTSCSGVDESTDLTNWNYFVGTHDSVTGTTSLFINGDFKDSQTKPGTTIDYTQTQNNFKLGGRDGGIYSFDGRVDEVRISNIGRSSEWIRTCYQNQNFPSDFISVGFEEPHP